MVFPWTPRVHLDLWQFDYHAWVRGEFVSLLFHIARLRYDMGRPTLEYNQLKIRILDIVNPSSEYDSVQIRESLASQGTRGLGEKSVEMALLRYWRQGLLSRTRHGRRFYYRLTERGEARKEWLLKSLKRT